MPDDVIPYFIGYDRSEVDAYNVCVSSFRNHCSVPSCIFPLNRDALTKIGVYSRESEIQMGREVDKSDGKPFSTEFSFSRFLVPSLMQFQGWALFTDCDFLFTADFASVWKLRDDSKAVMVVKQDYDPKELVKMDGKEQTRYRRKNWSSLILWNCGHPSNSILTPKEVNIRPGSWLHGFEWLQDYEIGDIDKRWNYLHNAVDKELPYAIHYTTGGPWHKEYQNCAYANEWREELKRIND